MRRYQCKLLDEFQNFKTIWFYNALIFNSMNNGVDCERHLKKMMERVEGLDLPSLYHSKKELCKYAYRLIIKNEKVSIL